MSERKGRTKLGLSKYAADAAERVVEQMASRQACLF
jgi:hypothetical protein